MTKEEKIKEVYLELYNSKKHLIDAYGWFNNSNENDAVTMGETNFLGECDYINEYWFRPKSLSGIEDNNGWVKLEGLPNEIKDICAIWIETKNGDIEYLKENEFLPVGYAVAYKVVEKPKKRIY